MKLAMEYQVVLERDDGSRHYTASVPGLPIVVDATSKKEALRLARQAISLYLEQTHGPHAQTIHAELVTVRVSDAAAGT